MVNLSHKYAQFQVKVWIVTIIDLTQSVPYRETPHAFIILIIIYPCKGYTHATFPNEFHMDIQYVNVF